MSDYQPKHDPTPLLPRERHEEFRRDYAQRMPNLEMCQKYGFKSVSTIYSWATKLNARREGD